MRKLWRPCSCDGSLSSLIFLYGIVLGDEGCCVIYIVCPAACLLQNRFAQSRINQNALAYFCMLQFLSWDVQVSLISNIAEAAEMINACRQACGQPLLEISSNQTDMLLGAAAGSALQASYNIRSVVPAVVGGAATEPAAPARAMVLHRAAQEQALLPVPATEPDVQVLYEVEHANTLPTYEPAVVPGFRSSSNLQQQHNPPFNQNNTALLYQQQTYI